MKHWTQESQLPYGPAFGVIEFNSVARGFSNTQSLVQTGGLKVLETYPCASGRFVALLNGDAHAVKAAIQSIIASLNESDLHDSICFDVFPFEILKALYGLASHASPASAVYVVETTSLSALLDFSKTVLDVSTAAIADMRGPRGTTGSCFAYLVGESAELKKGLREVEESSRSSFLIAHALVENPIDF